MKPDLGPSSRDTVHELLEGAARAAEAMQQPIKGLRADAFGSGELQPIQTLGQGQGLCHDLEFTASILRFN